jgi:hypothetical protein
VARLRGSPITHAGNARQERNRPSTRRHSHGGRSGARHARGASVTGISTRRWRPRVRGGVWPCQRTHRCMIDRIRPRSAPAAGRRAPQGTGPKRLMLPSDSVGGADASRNGFSNRMPVKMVDRSVISAASWGRKMAMLGRSHAPRQCRSARAARPSGTAARRPVVDPAEAYSRILPIMPARDAGGAARRPGRPPLRAQAPIRCQVLTACVADGIRRPDRGYDPTGA